MITFYHIVLLHPDLFTLPNLERLCNHNLPSSSILKIMEWI